jgi:23S rRNA-intervening sequence protein
LITRIGLNIAEGAGEFSKGDKARFYRMAKRSATECAAVLDICRELQITTAPPLIEGREILVTIVSMLIKLIRSFEMLLQSRGQARAKARAPAASRLGTEEAGAESASAS